MTMEDKQKNDMNEELKGLLYKPVEIVYEDLNFIGIIYKTEESNSTYLNHLGKQANKRVTTLYVADINASANVGQSQIQTIKLEDSSIIRLNPIDPKSIPQLVSIMKSILDHEIRGYTDTINELMRIMMCIPYSLSRPEDEDKSQSIISMSVVKMFEKSPLNKVEIEKIIPEIMQIINNSSDIYTDDERSMSELKKEIELAIIDLLPNSVSLQDLNINMDVVKQIIDGPQYDEDGDIEEDDDDTETK